MHRHARCTCRSFGIRAGNQQFCIVFQEHAQAIGIFFQTIAEALVGKVKQWQPAFSAESFAKVSHCSGVGSIPVGLWQQPCSRTMSPFALGSNLQSCRPNPSSVWRHHSSDKVCLGYRPLWQWRCGLPGRIEPDGLRVQLTFGKFGTIRNAPVPPRLCAVLARRLAMISWSLPNSRIWVCSL